jgi:aminobenzoyl-glutamate utilization protein B
MKKITLLLVLTCMQTGIFAQKGNETILKELEKNKDAYGVIAQQIWDYAEMGYLEEQSTALLQKTLSDEGFAI